MSSILTISPTEQSLIFSRHLTDEEAASCPPLNPDARLREPTSDGFCFVRGVWRDMRVVGLRVEHEVEAPACSRWLAASDYEEQARGRGRPAPSAAEAEIPAILAQLPTEMREGAEAALRRLFAASRDV